jgi:2-polyprenyl-3-methyl-5-hydroxy-6-metoxy-1,4-benzoquinol methylase
MGDQGRGGLFSPYLRNARFGQAIPWLHGRVLDFGCGVGELAKHCRPDAYLGVERDARALAEARRRFPSHRFVRELPVSGCFDRVVALAVIEHLRQPEEWLAQIRGLLDPEGLIVLTTPYPAFRRIHDAGALLGLFSREAAEEHETFFDAAALKRLAKPLGLSMYRSRRFLFGANQLFILQHLSAIRTTAPEISV